jgi:hypothetical protein
MGVDGVSRVIGYVELRGGQPAPVAGTYIEQNVFGTLTGREVTVMRGNPLPGTPEGFTWQLKSPAQDKDDSWPGRPGATAA